MVPPALRLPQVFLATMIFALATWIHTRLPLPLMALIFLPNLLVHFSQRALAAYLERDAAPGGKMMGFYFDERSHPLLTLFLRACAAHHLWQLPLLSSAATLAIVHRETGEPLALAGMVIFYVLVLSLECFVLVTGVRTAATFRRSRGL
jgi:hypothetical protein